MSPRSCGARLQACEWTGGVLRPAGVPPGDEGGVVGGRVDAVRGVIDRGCGDGNSRLHGPQLLEALQGGKPRRRQ